MVELTEAGHKDVASLDLERFGRLVLLHYERQGQESERDFANVRMAMHADKKAAKGYVRSLKPNPIQAVRSDLKSGETFLRSVDKS